MRTSRVPWLRFWIVSWITFAGLELTALGITDRTWEAPHVLFWVVLVAAVLAPVEATTPLRAVELGLDPLVHRFVAALEHKDEITRDHVVRAAHMTSLVATEMGVPARDHSTIVLGGLLHDVGKLDVPDAILNKPDRLTADEFAVVKRHPAVGAAMVAASEGLADLAPVVRHHHERVDGGGYPDGLAGDAIPLGARIVAACDAYDAMANTRQYREGMGADRALAVLAEHAGSQWDRDVVDALRRVVERHGPAFTGDALATVGRDEAEVEGFIHELTQWCGCADALPAEVVEPPRSTPEVSPVPAASPSPTAAPAPALKDDRPIDGERPWRVGQRRRSYADR